MEISSATWDIGSAIIACDRPVIMGVINVTPDSFSDGGRFFDQIDAVKQGMKLANDGADILDIGGESTRPGSDPVSVEDELSRVIPVIKGLREIGITKPISIDTRKLAVAEKAVQAGANIVNDVSALRDDTELASFCAEKKIGLVLMHMLGRPRTMQVEVRYDDVIREIGEFFEERLAFASQNGIDENKIALDPGIGFGKLLEHNLRILNECGKWLEFGRPILIGPSRKRFIGELTGEGTDERLGGTIAACIMAFLSGARIFRVHDVKHVKQALDVANAIYVKK